MPYSYENPPASDPGNPGELYSYLIHTVNALKEALADSTANLKGQEAYVKSLKSKISTMEIDSEHLDARLNEEVTRAYELQDQLTEAKITINELRIQIGTIRSEALPPMPTRWQRPER